MAGAPTMSERAPHLPRLEGRPDHAHCHLPVMAITKCLIGMAPVKRFTAALKALSQCGRTSAMVAGLTWRKIMSNRACAVTLIALAMVTVAGAPASARPISENTIRRECRLANGVYTTQVLTSNGTSTRLSHLRLPGHQRYLVYGLLP